VRSDGLSAVMGFLACSGAASVPGFSASGIFGRRARFRSVRHDGRRACLLPAGPRPERGGAVFLPAHAADAGGFRVRRPPDRESGAGLGRGRT
jgi:hypothetical protein